MRCILAATDGSESANRAVDAAAQIAKRFDAKLMVVNAIDRGVLFTDEMKRFTEVEGMLLGEALTSLSSGILRDAECQAKKHGLTNVQMESREGEAAQVVMEIVPDSDDLQVEAKLQPKDIDQVKVGQTTFVKFSAFNQRTTPQLSGVVSYVSADLSHDQQNDAGYYTVKVTLPEEERRRLGGLQLMSGMPAPAAPSFSGTSATIASVVRMFFAIDAAF